MVHLIANGHFPSRKPIYLFCRFEPPLLNSALEPVCPKCTQRNTESTENTPGNEDVSIFHKSPHKCPNIKKARRASNGL